MAVQLFILSVPDDSISETLYVINPILTFSLFFC